MSGNDRSSQLHFIDEDDFREFMGHRSEYMSDGEIENMDRNVENATSVNVINNAGPRAIGAILIADIPVDSMPILSDEELIEIDADRVSLDARRRANLTRRVELAMIAARRRRTRVEAQEQRDIQNEARRLARANWSQDDREAQTAARRQSRANRSQDNRAVT